MNRGASYTEVASFAASHRCAICKGLLEVVVKGGRYAAFCASSRGEHTETEPLPSKEQRFAEHVEAVKALPKGEMTKEDIFGKDGY